jgi:hypothetical protein
MLDKFGYSVCTLASVAKELLCEDNYVGVGRGQMTVGSSPQNRSYKEGGKVAGFKGIGFSSWNGIENRSR